MKLINSFPLAALILAAGTSLHATSTVFGLLNDPNQNFSFQRTDSPAGATITDPVGPYPGFLGANIPGDLYGFFCIDYLKTATWGTSYPGTLYNIGGAVPGKTLQQQLEAGFLSDQLYRLGGSNASTSLYQGPISFAIWQIMDPTPGDVPRDPAAQAWVEQAVNMYNAGLLSAADFSNTLIFVPNDPALQDFMTLSASPTPEPQTVTLCAGALLIILGKLRRRRV
jgi:hypothetical protein